MTKFHVNVETGAIGRCEAEAGNCPVTGESNHGGNLQEAKQILETRMKEKHGGSFGNSLQKKDRVAAVKTRKSVDVVTDEIAGQKLSKREAEFRSRFAEMSADVVALRAKLGDLSVDQDKGDPVRAQESLRNAISFATTRGNTHIMEKLAKAKAMPTSVIRTNNGDKIYSDDLSDVDRAVKHIEDGRESIQASVMALTNAPVGKYTEKTKDGTFSITVSDDGVNKDEFEKLPEDVRQQISKPRENLSIDLARDNLSQEDYNKIVSQSQVLDYVNGRPRDIGLKNVPVKTQLSGNDDAEKAQDGARSLANLYGTSKKQFGANFKDLKKQKDEMSTTVKQAAMINSQTENTYIPGRSRHNGLIVSGRQNINAKVAREVLSKEKLNSITNISHVPDIEKAKEVLSAETFDKIFKNRKVSLRVTEAS